jgi:hypothetical protein
MNWRWSRIFAISIQLSFDNEHFTIASHPTITAPDARNSTEQAAHYHTLASYLTQHFAGSVDFLSGVEQPYADNPVS